ncbi:hypothetical protein CHCC19467_3158 [Bacillus paralicheniformis]|nr:hypothetical protein SC10_B2orf00194 [Bacillus paralicheniformis]TWJ63214.1 hypothetical protein CHCC5021_2977 [Bacillus paralicheniformis]TWL10386.1 hypothetical protein CHCC19468_0072 [Bacillus paralicheniformis]TWL17471.1 hypothetical protein CHCC19467_3158 [Bacillus paralicheniformis]TWL56874.1 hypothetical protein CHCC15332_0938 [Bacillus paralicheniformis]
MNGIPDLLQAKLGRYRDGLLRLDRISRLHERLLKRHKYQLFQSNLMVV